MFKFLKQTLKSATQKIEGFNLVDTGRSNNIDVDVLKDLRNDIKDEDLLKQIDLDIKLFEIGEFGEDSVLYELKNSDIPMYCFRNVHLEMDDRSAQIDLLVVTQKFICAIEVKNLTGDIKVHSDGKFERFIKNKKGKLIKRTNMYSPVEQNNRHARILEKMLKSEKIIKFCPVHSLVVLAKTEGNLDTRYAQKEVKNSIILKDQLRNKLIEFENHKSSINMNYSSVERIVEFLEKHDELASSKYENPKIAQYRKAIKEHRFETKTEKVKDSKKHKHTKAENESETKSVIQAETCQAKSDDELRKKLKKFRMTEAKKANLKPYLVFYDAHLDDIIEKKPKSSGELMSVKGFGKVKVEKYGDGILRIVREFAG